MVRSRRACVALSPLIDAVSDIGYVTCQIVLPKQLHDSVNVRRRFYFHLGAGAASPHFKIVLAKNSGGIIAIVHPETQHRKILHIEGWQQQIIGYWIFSAILLYYWIIGHQTIGTIFQEWLKTRHS